jgi:ribosomal protein S18 acetylase RimI-like enzyme
MDVTIREMTLDDYDAVLSLWQASDGVGLSEADARENVAGYLERNPGLSFVAHDGGQLVGAVLCGHDGRRGFIHHLAVRQSHRRHGVGRALAEQCLTRLDAEGIQKCHLFVFATNHDAIAFWQRVGWHQRTDLTVMSQYTEPAGRQ